jgi:hypothetical protein
MANFTDEEIKTLKNDTGSALTACLCGDILEARAETASLRAALAAQPDPRVKGLVEALERIERWHGEFPSTGRTWDDKPGGEPMSYAAVNGSNGERDYMRQVAREALAAAKGEPAEPIALSTLHVDRDFGAEVASAEPVAERPWTRSEERMPDVGSLARVRQIGSCGNGVIRRVCADLNWWMFLDTGQTAERVKGTEWRLVEG